MIFIQITPPPLAPPPPPGLPIDLGLFFLMSLGIIYAVLIIRNHTIYMHLDSSLICDFKVMKRKTLCKI